MQRAESVHLTGRFTYPDDENPFDERQAEAGDGAVAAGRRRRQAEGQEEADPVEEERHWDFNQKETPG